MERNRSKSKGSKNGIHGVPETADRSAVRQAIKAPAEASSERLNDILAPLGLEIHLRGSRRQMKKLNEVETLLATANIHYVRKDYRPDAISLFVTVPGQRWEVDVTDDGEVEWECFKSDGNLFEESDLEKQIGIFAEAK
jgi:hypothetical protein